MNIIWTTLILASLLSLVFVSPESLLSATIDGGKTAVTTAISLMAVYFLWQGLFNVMEKSGLIEKIAKITRPVIRLLYGKIEDAAASYIALNMSANMLGVSNAATPSAVAAMKILEKDNATLSRSGAMLFVINATSIQLLPSTVMGMRAALGDPAPADIILPTLISTVITTVLGVLLVNLAYGRRK
jgi:spore maturation protein A